MNVIIHIQLAILIGDIVELLIGIEIDHKEIMVFVLKLQRRVHHVRIAVIVIVAACVHNHRAIPGLMSIVDDILNSPDDRLCIEILQVSAVADLSKIFFHGRVVGGELHQKYIAVRVRIQIVFHPAHIGGTPTVHQGRAADRFLDQVHPQPCGKILAHCLLHGGCAVSHGGPQGKHGLPFHGAVLILLQIREIVLLGVSRQTFHPHFLKPLQRPHTAQQSQKNHLDHNQNYYHNHNNHHNFLPLFRHKNSLLQNLKNTFQIHFKGVLYYRPITI